MNEYTAEQHGRCFPQNNGLLRFSRVEHLSSKKIGPADVIELLESPKFVYFGNINNNSNVPVFEANNRDSGSDSDSENPFSIEIDVEDDF